MPQPVPKNKKNLSKEKKKKPVRINKYVRNHPQYGTSKLEEKFAKEFLDVLGVSYQYQFEAKDIKRFFDFLVEGIVLIEIDGGVGEQNVKMCAEAGVDICVAGTSVFKAEDAGEAIKTLKALCE